MAKLLVLAGLFLASFGLVCGNMASFLKKASDKGRSHEISANDVHGLHKYMQAASHTSTSTPTGYITASIYTGVTCSGSVAMTASIATGICVSAADLFESPASLSMVDDDDSFMGLLSGSEMMTVSSATLFGSTTYFVTVNVYSDNNCQHLNISQIIPFIGGDCVATGSIISLDYATSLPSVPGYGLVTEVYGSLGDCSSSSAILSRTYFATNICFSTFETSVYVTSCTGASILTVFNDTDCSPGHVLYNTSIALPSLENVCVSLPNTTAYVTTTCLSASSGGGGSSSTSCFAGSETVVLQDGRVKALEDVEVGDVVLSANAKGEVVYSPVIAVPHEYTATKTMSSFVHLITADGSDIKLTEDHLILTTDCTSSTASSELTAAKDVTAGMCLLNRHHQSTAVTSATTIKAFDSKHTIVTMEEYVVVNGLLASPFAANHAVGHAYYNILRMLYSIDVFAAIKDSMWAAKASELAGGLFAWVSEL